MTRATKRAVHSHASSSGGAHIAGESPRIDISPGEPFASEPPAPAGGGRPQGPVAQPMASDGSTGWRLDLTLEERRHLERTLSPLTVREREVACAVCAGGDNEAVADRLCIALPTLRTHLMRIYQKLGATNKSDLIRRLTAELLDGYRRGRILPEAISRPKSLDTKDLSTGWLGGGALVAHGKSSFPMMTGGRPGGQ